MLNPLRNTANRVADQIDQFAQNLGRFKRQSRGPDDPEAFNAACDLVRKYRTIAEHSVEDLSQDPLKKAKQLIQSARGTSLEDRRNGEQIMRWKLEAETWELLFELLSVDGPERRRKAEWAQRTVLQDIHRYSSDAEVWDKFLEADHFALECVIILKWLEKSARGSGSDQMIDQLVSNLETQAERGQGLWAHGWLYTKETIKQAKRLRSWPQPLETSDGNLSSSLIHSDQKEPLITQLDPDAVTRQNHGLQKQDQFFEQATWLSLWKMLREGQSWSRIQEWARERLENWRAASVCGSFSDEEARDGFARMMRCQSQESWLAACSALANNPRSHPVERAVYGLLCGETEPAYAACQGWSDHVYVYFNYIVISRFRSFCQQVQRKLSYSPAAAAKLVVEAPGYTDVHNYLESIKKNERVRAEAKNPYRTIQAAMLSKSYDMFFYQQANGLSVVANESADETLVPKSAVVGVDDAVLIAGRDENAVRIVAHMLPILQSVGRLRADSGFQQMVAVNVVGYVSILQKLRRQELIPLYASVMPMPLMHVVLGRTLVDVVKPAERKRMVKLMENLRIDTGWVMRRQWRYVVGRAQEKQSSGPVQVRRTVMKPPGEPPRIVRPKRNLVGRRVSPEAERMIRSLDWRRYVGGQFGSICQIGTFLYKRFLSEYIHTYMLDTTPAMGRLTGCPASGKLSEAREVLSRCPLSQLSIDSLGYDVTTHPDLWADDGLDGVDRAATTTTTTTMNGEGKTERAKAERQQYYAESQTMHDLEQLVAAFDALEAWANLVDHCEQLSGEQEFREFRHPLQEALDELTTRMEPLFTSGWLLDGLKKSNGECDLGPTDGHPPPARGGEGEGEGDTRWLTETTTQTQTKRSWSSSTQRTFPRSCWATTRRSTRRGASWGARS